jgi:carboxypeptidase Taq
MPFFPFFPCFPFLEAFRVAVNQELLERLKFLLAESRDLDRAASVLEWDQQTYMPPGGAPARAEALATLERLAHERYTSDEMGRLLDALGQNGALGDYDSDNASLVRVNRREYAQQRRVPSELVGEIARAQGLAIAAWEEAKHSSDYSLLRPHLERVFELKRRWAERFQTAELYDALLERYEPGLTTAQVQALFAQLRAGLVPLVRAIAARSEAVDDACVHGEFDSKKQWDFGLAVAGRFGFDFRQGRQDASAHPFTARFTNADVRLTTRVLPDLLTSALFSTVHEAGHGLYEQGVSAALERTWLDRGASLGVHESQSRLWENHVGRSRAFWQYWFPALQAVFPEQLRGQDAESFYRAVNKVMPSLIRTEADEATYDLHIMLRVELEQALLAGEVNFAELPELWRARMHEYLGVVPETDAEGVLQDIHWPSGLVGYFATYTLGNVLAAQLFEQVAREIPGLAEQFASGEYSPLLAWLRDRIHRHGRKYTLDELARRATGRPLTAEPYLRYLRAKFSEIYGLDEAALA